MKRTQHYGGGQRVLSPHKIFSDRTVRKMIIEAHRLGEDIVETIDAMSPKNAARAWELYNECPALDQVLRAA